MIKKLYKDGKKRAVTFSFDDGNPQDIRLADIFNKYGLKCTFNLSGGKCKNPTYRIKEDGVSYWDGSNELRQAYSGHEIACHGYLHPHYSEYTDKEVQDDLKSDHKTLSRVFGYKIRGFASPFGQYDERVINCLKSLGIVYNRTTKRKDDFKVSENFYEWASNGHFSTFMFDEGKELLKNFFACDTELALLYIWGHSYEITDYDAYGFEKWQGLRDRWKATEDLCKSVANKSDTWYATNIEIVDYINAMRKAHISETYIDNPTSIPLYFEINGKLIVAPPMSRFGF